MSTIDREEAIRLIASYPGPVDKSVVRRLLTQMPNLQPTCNQLATDCISRQLAIDAVYGRIRQIGYENNPHVLSIRQTIRDLPSAQPERKVGKWIDETFKPWGLAFHPYKCDQCGEHSETDSNFCPNCGAKMEGEQDEERH